MSNLYSQRVFSEHPIHVWSLEEREVETLSKFHYNYDLDADKMPETNIRGYWTNSMGSNNRPDAETPRHNLFYVSKDQEFENGSTALCYQDTGFCIYQDLECSRTPKKELPFPGCDTDTTICEDGYSKYGDMYTETDYSPWFFNNYGGINTVCLPRPFEGGGYWRRGMPMVIGSNGTTTLNPFRNTVETRPTELLPALIVDGAGFLSEQGKDSTYTFEFWMRISDSSLAPVRILGPFEDGNTDGLWLKDGMLTYVVGKKSFVSFNVGNIDAPSLIQLTYSPSAMSLIVNGEIVAEAPVGTEGEYHLARTRYLAFFTYAELGKFEIDVPSVYGYLVPDFLCKRRFVYGEGTEELENINESFLGEGVISDYASTDKFSSLAYPRNMFWESGESENIIVSNDKIGPETKPLPTLNFESGANKQEWFDVLDGIVGDEEPYFEFDDIVVNPDTGESVELGDFRYVRFNYLSNFVSNLRGIYLDFQVESGDIFRLTSSHYTSRSLLGYVQDDEFRVDYRDSSIGFSQKIYPNKDVGDIDISKQRYRLYFDLRSLFVDEMEISDELINIVPQLRAMLADPASLNLIVGSENKIQYDGEAYCFPNNFCSYDKLADSYCNDSSDIEWENGCDSFKSYDDLAENTDSVCEDGNRTYPPYLLGPSNQYDNLAYCASPGFVGKIYSVGFAGEQNHKMARLGGGRGEIIYRVPEAMSDNYSILTYSWRPTNDIVSFTDDVFSKSYWEDYFPLTSIASDVNGAFELDSIQFNVSQPRHLLDITVAAEGATGGAGTFDGEPCGYDQVCDDCGNVLCAPYVGGLCSYEVLKCSACECSPEPSKLHIKCYDDLKQNYENLGEVRASCEYLAPVNSAVTLVKLWKNGETYEFEGVTSGVSRPVPGSIAAFPFAYLEDVNYVDISAGVSEGTTAIYQVVDDTNILIDELNADESLSLEDYKLGVYVELTSRGNTVEPVTLSQMEFSSYA